MKRLKMKEMWCRASLFFAAALLAAVESHAQNVVTQWNSIASATIVAHGGKPPASSGVWFAYTSIAEYDAVNAIHRQFQPFYYKVRAPDDTSEEAAAVAAAHRVLVNYFPAQQPALDAQFVASLEKITAAPDAKAAGSPFTMTTASQFRPEGPTTLTSDEWEDDYSQTRILGDINSTVRTPEQTEIGLFWTEHTGQQYARAFGYFAENYKLNVMDTARLMAVLWTGFADSLIACFDAKYHYSFWRPVTAIRDGGGNSDLIADPNWTPLGVTPNHPEYPAAHACATSTASRLVRDYFGTHKVRIVVDSLAFSDGVHTHTFDDTTDWFDEVFWARIYAGFHYQHSLEDGGDIGRQVSKQLFRKNFRPQN